MVGGCWLVVRLRSRDERPSLDTIKQKKVRKEEIFLIKEAVEPVGSSIFSRGWFKKKNILIGYNLFPTLMNNELVFSYLVV